MVIGVESKSYVKALAKIDPRSRKVSHGIIRQRHGIGNSGIELIMNRYRKSGLTLEGLLKMEPSQVEGLIYPQRTSGRMTSLCLISNVAMIV